MSTVTVLADTHVHLYPYYSIAECIARAFSNIPAGSGEVRALFLTERMGTSVFSTLSRSNLSTGLSISPTLSPEVLSIRSAYGTLLICAGRQISTRERLEILTLGTLQEVSDNLPFEDTLRLARETGGRVVLPWSPGKWLGKRGETIMRTLSSSTSEDLAIGDIPIRSRLGKNPRQFKEAQKRGIPILAGTDPLPFKGDEQEIGRYGIRASVEMDIDRPLEGLMALLEGQREFFGKRDSILRAGMRYARARVAL